MYRDQLEIFLGVRILSIEKFKSKLYETLYNKLYTFNHYFVAVEVGILAKFGTQ